MLDSPIDACATLGVKNDATKEEVRKAYLELVHRHPPDQEPEQFRRIHAAYELLCDPLSQAAALVARQFERPDLSAVIATAEPHRPRLHKLALLALGNQE